MPSTTTVKVNPPKVGLPPDMEEYMIAVETGTIKACPEQHQLIEMTRDCFKNESIWVDAGRYEKYLKQVKYFPYKQLYPWEKFLLGIHLCTFRADGFPRWPDLFLLIGRGAGKDGYFAFESYCVATPINGIKGYNVDISAMSENQSKIPFEDLKKVLEDDRFTYLHRRHWYWNSEMIESIDTRSVIKYHTNNPKGKDSLRTGMVIFNEMHAYENYANIEVFTSGLGKRAHPRRIFASTDGTVRDGPLDHYKARSIEILSRKIPDGGFFPFICWLPDKDLVDDEENWQMPNPSLPYNPDLYEEIRKQYIEWKRDPLHNIEFMTKRMNHPEENAETVAVPWKQIEKATRKRPDTTDRDAIIGIDFAKSRDLVSVGKLSKVGEVFVWKSHSWLCMKSTDIHRMDMERLRAAEKMGKLTFIEDDEIPGSVVTDWIENEMQDSNIIMTCIDGFRYALMRHWLLKIGISHDQKNLKQVRPSDIMRIIPVIDSAFLNERVAWGEEEPMMRWGTNNTKKVPASGAVKARSGPDEMGNELYGKIEAHSRKTDPFMAFVSAMTQEALLDGEEVEDEGLWMPVITG